MDFKLTGPHGSKTSVYQPRQIKSERKKAGEEGYFKRVDCFPDNTDKPVRASKQRDRQNHQ